MQKGATAQKVETQRSDSFIKKPTNMDELMSIIYDTVIDKGWHRRVAGNTLRMKDVSPTFDIDVVIKVEKK